MLSPQPPRTGFARRFPHITDTVPTTLDAVTTCVGTSQHLSTPSFSASTTVSVLQQHLCILCVGQRTPALPRERDLQIDALAAAVEAIVRPRKLSHDASRLHRERSHRLVVVGVGKHAILQQPVDDDDLLGFEPKRSFPLLVGARRNRDGHLNTRCCTVSQRHRIPTQRSSGVAAAGNHDRARAELLAQLPNECCIGLSHEHFRLGRAVPASVDARQGREVHFKGRQAARQRCANALDRGSMNLVVRVGKTRGAARGIGVKDVGRIWRRRREELSEEVGLRRRCPWAGPH
mmetsp:Transcript_18071/g.47617  ORF Transcript_18071/g.47617 Transcript_18071/m.47617 type:complete len:290 (-) Transcript_18071:78-947(-)